MAQGQVAGRLVLLLLASFFARARAATFLGPSAPTAVFADLDRQIIFLDQLEDAVGPGHREGVEARLQDIVGDLRATFDSLPKNHRGALRASTARYALHRLLLKRHGWQVTGIAPAGDAWASLSPARALDGLVPRQRVQEQLEQRMAADGIGLHELAAVASAIEHLTHGRAVETFQAVYRAFGKLPWDVLAEEEAMEVIEKYMAVHLMAHSLGVRIPDITAAEVELLWVQANELYPGWRATLDFVRQVRSTAWHEFVVWDMSSLSKLVKELVEHYGLFQQQACAHFKDRLLRLEESNGTGRVLLSAFYKSSVVDGNDRFTEREEYLRQLGVLDDTAAQEPRLMISNYLYNPTNCLSTSDHYANCCMDECEGLMAGIEREIVAPAARPGEVALVVTSALPAAPLGAEGGDLPEALLGRLREVASLHGGLVPLHGRLFAQWMHHAFPRQCAYPHAAGSLGLLVGPEFLQATGLDADYSKLELLRLSEQAQRRKAPAPAAQGLSADLWSPEEELVDRVHGGAQSSARSTGASASWSLQQPPWLESLLLLGSLLGALRVADLRGAIAAMSATQTTPSSCGKQRYVL